MDNANQSERISAIAIAFRNVCEGVALVSKDYIIDDTLNGGCFASRCKDIRSTGRVAC